MKGTADSNGEALQHVESLCGESLQRVRQGNTPGHRSRSLYLVFETQISGHKPPLDGTSKNHRPLWRSQSQEDRALLVVPLPLGIHFAPVRREFC